MVSGGLLAQKLVHTLRVAYTLLRNPVMCCRWRRRGAAAILRGREYV